MLLLQRRRVLNKRLQIKDNQITKECQNINKPVDGMNKQLKSLDLGLAVVAEFQMGIG